LTPFIPGPPVAADDTASASWDVTQSVNVLGNDSVDAGQSLVASSVRLCGAGDVSPACDDTQVTTAQGTYTVDLATGAVSFDPLPTFWGTATPITYTVTDSQGLKDPATLTVTVSAPGLPVAADDTVLVSPGGSVAFDPLIGAGGLSSSGGPALASACLWVSSACDGDGVVVVVNSGGGVYVLDAATKVVTFHACTGVGVPHASCTQALSGQPESVAYRVTDAVSQADMGVLTARVPAAPVSRDDSSMAEAGATQVITPLGNDQAGDAALSVASLKLCGLSPAQTPPNCTQASITTAAGVYTVAGGSVTFVPADDTPGTDVDVTYQVADTFGQTSSAVIRVTELPKPAPRPAPDALSGPYGQSLTFTPMTNDSFGTVPADDSTNNVLTQVQNTGWLAGSLKLCGVGQAPPGCDKTSVTTADGTYVIAGTDVVFTGNASFTGVATQPVMYQVANTYDVVVTDYNGSGTPSSTNYSKIGSSTITPTITVAPVSVTPDSASTPWNTPVTDNVLADDTSGAAINAGDLKLCGPNDAECARRRV
jgi:CshA-type fibril repeat protein